MGDGRFKAKDYRGKKIGLLTPIRPTAKRARDGSTVWVIKCDCGKVFEKPASRFATIYSCGCKQRFNSGRKTFKDLTGRRNYMVVAIEPTGNRCPHAGYKIWKLRCDCGIYFYRSSYLFTRGYTKSCGCSYFYEKKGRPPLPDSQAHVNNFYGHYRTSANTRGISFGITKAFARKLFESNCHYCGSPPRQGWNSKHLAGKYPRNGIDRKDSSKGYTIENCVPCCTQCNIAKNKYTTQEFLSWVKLVNDHMLL